MARPDRLDELQKAVSDLNQAFTNYKGKFESPVDAMEEWAWKNKRKIFIWVGGVLLTVIGAVVGIVYKAWPYMESASNRWADARISDQLKEPTKQLGDLRDEVKTMHAEFETLRPFINGLILKRLSESATLPQKEFEAQLPEIQKLIASAQEHGIKADPALLHRISQKLLDIKPRPKEFWPVGAQLVSYKSSQRTQVSPASLPNCIDSDPQPMRITAVLSSQVAQFSNALYENCQVALDSTKDNERINGIILGRFPRLTFRKCLITYHGGPINLKLEWVGETVTMHIEGHPPMPTKFTGPTLQFENCLFLFVIQGVPPPAGQQATETLLAQNADILKLPKP